MCRAYSTDHFSILLKPSTRLGSDTYESNHWFDSARVRTQEFESNGEVNAQVIHLMNIKMYY